MHHQHSAHDDHAWRGTATWERLLPGEIAVACGVRVAQAEWRSRCRPADQATFSWEPALTPGMERPVECEASAGQTNAVLQQSRQFKGA